MTYELSVERQIAAAPHKVWQIMTERTTEWWCPKPWTTEIIEQNWVTGGRSAMMMHGPNGETSGGDGFMIEVVPGQRFVFTDAILKRGEGDWVPQGPFMIGTFEIAPDGEGTRYRASARHWTEEAMEKHRAMGFEDGWGTVADQLKALCEG